MCACQFVRVRDARAYVQYIYTYIYTINGSLHLRACDIRAMMILNDEKDQMQYIYI